MSHWAVPANQKSKQNALVVALQVARACKSQLCDVAFYRLHTRNSKLFNRRFVLLKEETSKVNDHVYRSSQLTAAGTLLGVGPCGYQQSCQVCLCSCARPERSEAFVVSCVDISAVVE